MRTFDADRGWLTGGRCQSPVSCRIIAPRVHHTPMLERHAIANTEMVTDPDVDRLASSSNPHEVSPMSSRHPRPNEV
jgi:hypothetical protein